MCSYRRRCTARDEGSLFFLPSSRSSAPRGPARFPPSRQKIKEKKYCVAYRCVLCVLEEDFSFPTQMKQEEQIKTGRTVGVVLAYRAFVAEKTGSSTIPATIFFLSHFLSALIFLRRGGRREKNSVDSKTGFALLSSWRGGDDTLSKMTRCVLFSRNKTGRRGSLPRPLIRAKMSGESSPKQHSKPIRFPLPSTLGYMSVCGKLGGFSSTINHLLHSIERQVHVGTVGQLRRAGILLSRGKNRDFK